MIIRNLKVSDFRNYEDLTLDLSPGVNVLYGDNAQGKTNILEAIYVCATTRSHRGTRDREMIRFGQEEAHLRMISERREVPVRIDMHLKKGRSKGVAVNGLPIRRVSELFGLVNVVFFSPEDLSIIKDSPAERRRFMDLELCQLDPIYASDLSNYNKVLMQRNKLLKDLEEHPDLRDTLPVWDEQLIRYGRGIVERRDQFVGELNELIRDVHEQLTGGTEHLDVKYVPNVTADAFPATLQSQRARDLGARVSLTGPHRDDITCEVNGIDVRRFGSQGQQRTSALSLKLAEIRLVKQRIGENPVLLLDDVLSELDMNRQNHLLDSISHIQTILTCTGLDEFVRKNMTIDRKFRVKSGTVTEELL